MMAQRKMKKQGFAILALALAGSAAGRVVKDLVYTGGSSPELKLDLLLPDQIGMEKMPVVIAIHGGGWRKGSKGNPIWFKALPKEGIAVVDINYRLSAEAIFPAQIDDCKAAVKWVRGHASEYGFDPKRIGAGGSSAGGTLAALLGVQGDVVAVCSLFGPTDLLSMDQQGEENPRMIHDAPDSPESHLVGGPIKDEPFRALAKQASPFCFVGKECPPFLFIHGKKDGLVPFEQSRAMHEALRAVDVESKLVAVKNGTHGLRKDDFNPTAEQIQQMVANFFKQTLFGEGNHYED